MEVWKTMISKNPANPTCTSNIFTFPRYMVKNVDVFALF